MGDRRQETEGRRQEKGDGRQETGDRRCMGDRRWERVLCHTVLWSRSLDILVLNTDDILYSYIQKFSSCS